MRRTSSRTRRIDLLARPASRRTGHWYRNAFSHVPSTKVREFALMLKAIHAQECRAAARAKADEVIVKLKAMRLAKVAGWLEETVDETLVYYAFTDEHWRRIRTNNPLERIMREIHGRTRVVGAFPDGHALRAVRFTNPSNLAAAKLRHIAGTKWSAKRYMNMNLLKQQKMSA